MVFERNMFFEWFFMGFHGILCFFMVCLNGLTMMFSWVEGFFEGSFEVFFRLGVL